MTGNDLLKYLGLALLAAVLAGCASAPPENPDDLCAIFREEGSWYKHARSSYRRWGSPIPVMMAVARQESGFDRKAKPPRRKLLGFIPWMRPASAFGFAQALDETWSQYKKATGNWGADRDKFKDAIDFIGWYNDQSHRRNGIAKDDAYRLYLAYHEGQGGYASATYRKKQWLLDVANKVARQAKVYDGQLQKCEKSLRRGWLYRLFFS